VPPRTTTYGELIEESQWGPSCSNRRAPDGRPAHAAANPAGAAQREAVRRGASRRADVVRPVHGAAADHAVRHALRHPRDGPSLPAEDGPEPRRIVAGERRRLTPSSLRPKPQVSQRRPDPTRDVKFSASAIEAGSKELRPASARSTSSILTTASSSGRGRTHDLLRHDRHRGRHRRPRYLTQVGRRVSQQPIGAGPPLREPRRRGRVEAFRLLAPPAVKRLIMKSVTDGTTRAAVLRTVKRTSRTHSMALDAENVKARDPDRGSRHARSTGSNSPASDPKSP
jgi:hypothetical protein